MGKIEKSFFDIDSLETLSFQKTFIHSIDARVKIITSIIFIITILSFNKYTIAMLLPFFIYPIFILNTGNIPVTIILKKILILSPFILVIGIFNPFLDHAKIYNFNSFYITGGWISFLSILMRFFLTVSISFILISVTGFYCICIALNKIGIPSIFSLQLMLMYRYIFLLIEESFRLVLAYKLRSFSNKIKLKHFIYIISQLLIRTIDRAENIYNAMLARGFDGKLKIIIDKKINLKDVIFLITWVAYFIFFRFINIPRFFGKIITG